MNVAGRSRALASSVARTWLPSWLHQRARLTPNGIAVRVAGNLVTWQQLETMAAQRSAELSRLGIRSGDRVGLLMRNGLAFVEMVHAIDRLQAVLVPLNTRLAPDEIAFQVRDAKLSVVVYDEPDEALAGDVQRFSRRRRFAIATGNSIFLTSGTQRADVTAPAAESMRAADQIHCIVYTSGTTGRPKGAMLSYGNHWWSAYGSAVNLGVHADDVWLACLPLFHVGGLSILIRSAIYGIPVVIHEAFDEVLVNSAIDDDRVTIVSVVTAMLRRVLDARAGQPAPAWFRCALLGGGPAPIALLERCAATGFPVIQTYGLTETASQVATLSPADALRKIGSAGKPLVTTDLRIVANGDALTPGEVGEIVVRGPSVTAGYYRRADATTQTLRDGWLYTGDLGYVDAEGYLYVLDRREDLFISGGENVYPAEVEAALSAHPSVSEAAVVGVDDPNWGQRGRAYVRLRSGFTVDGEALLAFCRTRLASYKVPVTVQFVDELPRNASGKLLRRVLRDQ